MTLRLSSLSSLLGFLTPGVSVETYVETKRWLQERAAITGGVVQHHKHYTEELLACCVELGLSDADVLAFCKAYVEKNIFWIEWEIYDSRLDRRGFISNLRVGRETALLNLSQHH